MVSSVYLVRRGGSDELVGELGLVGLGSAGRVPGVAFLRIVREPTHCVYKSEEGVK
jgi:hypothetical protein